MFFLQIVNLERKGAAQLSNIVTILMVGLNRWDTTLIHLNYQKQDTKKKLRIFFNIKLYFSARIYFFL